MISQILALDTSTDTSVLAVSDGDSLLRATAVREDRRRGALLIPLISDFLSGAGTSLAEIDAFAVGLGPGSYTGLRVGLTAMKTFAFIFNKPLLAVSTPHAIALGATGAAESVEVAIDAQRGEAHVYRYQRSAAGVLEPGSERRTVPWREILEPGPGSAGADLTLTPHPPREFSASSVPGKLLIGAIPDPEAMIALARQSWERGERLDPMFAEPLYIRGSAAEEQWPARAKDARA